MKKIIALPFSLLLIISLQACSSSPKPNSVEDSAKTAARQTIEHQQERDQRDGKSRSSEVEKESIMNGGIAFGWCWLGLSDCD